MIAVLTSDGRAVTLYEDTWYGHILLRRPELGQLLRPIHEIERALVFPVFIRPSDRQGSMVYYGPPLEQTGFHFSGRCMQVIVHRDEAAVQSADKTKWYVATVVLRRAEDQFP